MNAERQQTQSARIVRALICSFSLGVLMIASGCTSRGMTITSVPPGAEVSINRRVVGVTPIRVGFTHYGTYRIELRKEKYQVLVKEEPVRPPIYGYDPVAAVADNLIPARMNDEVYLHYVMKPSEERDDKSALADRDSLMERADLARAGRVTNPRTGEEVEVVINRDAPKRKQPVVAAANDEEVFPKVADNGSSIIDKPIDVQPIKDIATPKPRDPQLADEFNVKPPEDKRIKFVSPTEAAPADKTAAPRVVRTPKSEELIFDETKPAPSKDKQDKSDIKK